VFSRQRYFTSVPADLEVGSSILKVEATDADKVRLSSNCALKILFA
jgi:hypothetical protein